MRRTPSKPGKALAVVLAIAVHVALALFLVFGVRWQNQHPDTMVVELVPPPAPIAKAPVVRPAPPKAEPPPPEPETKPEPKPEPPKVEPPPPKAQPPQPARADIALKAKQEKERLDKERADREREVQEKAKREQDRMARELREQREREMRDLAKTESEKREREVKELAKREADKRALEELKVAQERAQREAEDKRRRDELTRAEREQREQRERASAAASKSMAEYVDRIQAKIKGNVILPPTVTGNPEAEFEVIQLPTGEIISAELRKSSGSRAYDEAVTRAILKSSPLPLPNFADQFQRALKLKFRPQS